jgi:hypothetical protein
LEDQVGQKPHLKALVIAAGLLGLSTAANAKEICLLYCPVDVCEITYSQNNKSCSCTCKTFPTSTFDAFKERKLDTVSHPLLLKEGRDGNITFLPGRSANGNSTTNPGLIVDAREELNHPDVRDGERSRDTWERMERERIVGAAGAANGAMRGDLGKRGK